MNRQLKRQRYYMRVACKSINKLSMIIILCLVSSFLFILVECLVKPGRFKTTQHTQQQKKKK